MNRKRGIGLLLTIVVMAIGLASVTTTPTTDDYRITSYTEGGYRGIARVLEKLGFSVQAVEPMDTSEVDVLVIPDPFLGGKAESAAWRKFASAGGLVVLGYPFADRLGTDAEFTGLPDSQGRGPCTLHLARGLDDWQGDFGMVVPRGVRSCFDEGGVAPFFETAVGQGEVLTLADPGLLSNEAIGRFDKDGEALAGKDQPDNAGAIAELMARAGSRVGFVAPDFIPVGESYSTQTMWDFVPRWVIVVALQVLVALLWLAWWAARRPARLVHEPVPVMIAASELVEATGSLLRRRRDPPASAATIRTATLGRLASIWGMPADSPPEQFAYEATRQGVDSEFVQELVDFDEESSTMTDPELVDFAQRCARVRAMAERSMSTDVRSH